MNDLERQVDELLRPLAKISPAQRSSGKPRARRDLIIGIALAVVLVLVALGATYLTLDLTASPNRSPISKRGSLSCLKLVGGTAAHAQKSLVRHGYTVEWRFEKFNADRTFETTNPPSVPANSVVEDVQNGGAGSVLVFVYAPDDHYAPRPTPPVCSR